MCDFLTNEICKIGKDKLAANKKVIIAGGYKEGERVVCVSREVCEDLEDLSSDQEEADTRLLLHAKYATRPETRIIVQSLVTNVLVLCTTHFSDISCEELWFRTGVRDHHRYYSYAKSWARSCARVFQPFMPLRGATRQVR